MGDVRSMHQGGALVALLGFSGTTVKPQTGFVFPQDVGSVTEFTLSTHFGQKT